MWLIRYTTQAIIINKTITEQGDSQHYYFSLPIFDLLQPLQVIKLKIYRIYRGKGDFMRR